MNLSCVKWKSDYVLQCQQTFWSVLSASEIHLLCLLCMKFSCRGLGLVFHNKDGESGESKLSKVM